MPVGVRIVSVYIDRMASAATTHRGPGGRPFVGRERELALLRAALQDARGGRGRLAVITGEAGAGKSWLAEEIALEARETGAQVAWGRCYPGTGAPAFFAWAQVLRACLRIADTEQLQSLVNAVAAQLAHVVPGLRERVAEPQSAPPAPDGAEARRRLFDSVARLLEGIGDSAPLVVILDDLHAADQPSLRLFEFLVHEMGHMHLLLVATCRDVGASPDFAEILADAVRESGAERIDLCGFTVDEVALVIELYGVQPQAGLAEALHRQAGGSPLFVGEFVRMIAAEKRLHEASTAAAASLAIPNSARAVIHQRLATVSEPCRAVLDVAAVAGHAFSIDVLRCGWNRG
jgi:predicted ATPase